MPRTYNDQARQRIAAAVRKIERLETNERAGRSRRPGAPMVPTFFVAKEDIEHGQIGKGRRTESPAFDSGRSEVDWEEDVDIYNPGFKVFTNAELVCEMVGLAGADSGSEYIWTIRHAWSATRIRGISAAQISPGGSGLISSVKGLDGPGPGSSVTVHMPTQYVTIEPSRVVWAELAWDPGRVPPSRWEVYSADCDGGNP